MQRPLLVALLLGTVAVTASAQGTGPYLNFEAPTQDSLAIATVGNDDYLLVANAPDNAVEIYDVATLQFQGRIPTDLEPVSVVVRPSLDAQGRTVGYTVNHIGDSITKFTLGATGNPAQPIIGTFDRTIACADAPVGIAVQPEVAGVPFTLPASPSHEALFVTHADQGFWSVHDSDTLAPLLPAWDRLELNSAAGDRALKRPTDIAFMPTTAGVLPRLFVLNERGGQAIADAAALADYDFDLWSSFDTGWSAATERAKGPELGGLGTHNFDMTFTEDASPELYVVGQFARNLDLNHYLASDGERQFRSMEVNDTGFVRSELYRVTSIGMTGTVVETLDLNRDRASGTLPITQPMAVAWHDTPTGERRIFVAGFNSDTVGVVVPDPVNFAQGSIIVSIDINPGGLSPTNLSSDMHGPRALITHDDRVYVYNRLTSSVTVLDADFVIGAPSSPLVTTISLANDPESAVMKAGRKYLFSSRLSAGGTSSCASCHISAHHDNLAWNLSGGMGTQSVLPGAIVPENPPFLQVEHKGPLATQSLKGLVNYEVIGEGIQDLMFSNRPYHWRGDKGAFIDFNAAYVNLMGIDVLQQPYTFVDPSDGSLNRGIPVSAMEDFKAYIHTVHYPPNTEQPVDRRFSGEFGDGTQTTAVAANDPKSGSGAQRGLKLFHVTLNAEAENCVQCHALPIGSDNVETQATPDPGIPPNQALETGALRNIEDKARMRQRRTRTDDPRQPPFDFPGKPIGNFGLVHDGLARGSDTIRSQSVLGFITVFLSGSSIGTEEAVALAEFLREFDTGTAPAVGQGGTIESAIWTAATSQQQQSVRDSVALFETQVREGNVGLAVHAMLGGQLRGFWFDVSATPPVYREVPWAGSPTSGTMRGPDLLRALDTAGQHVTWYCTPLGSARRMASLDGGLPPALATGPAPSNLQLETMRPNTALENVLMMDRAFEDLGEQRATTVRLLQRALWQFADDPLGYDVGLDGLRHEAPRRFRVSGDDIPAEGAFLVITFPGIDPANPTVPSTNPNALFASSVAMPIFAT
ncbi:MAG: hypothetical protein VX815_05590, partial [Gemmatimonadota bacterium]|nr:hypothetical protein [Gemmatimonadota bacterium]